MVTINKNYFIKKKNNKTKQTITNNNKNNNDDNNYKLKLLKYKLYYFNECYKISVFPISNIYNKFKF